MSKEVRSVLNLKKELAEKGISYTVVASLLGVSDKTAWNKVNGECEFTVSEALKVKQNLFPEFEISYLFSNRDEEEKQ